MWGAIEQEQNGALVGELYAGVGAGWQQAFLC